jgi:hypothetical protein
MSRAFLHLSNTTLATLGGFCGLPNPPESILDYFLNEHL